MQKYGLLIWVCFPIALSSQPVAVGLDKMNALYVGVPNALTFVVSDVPADHVLLRPSQGEIMATDKIQGQYDWTICDMDSTRAWLILVDSLSGAILDTSFFRVKRLPEPQFIKAKGNPGSGGMVALLNGPACTADWRAQMLGYELTILSKNQDAVVLYNRGARFNADVTDHFKRLVPGDQVIFYHFTWTGGCDPTIRHSDESLYFKIK